MKCAKKTFAQTRIIKSEDASTFNCTGCNFTSPSESAAKKHVIRVHVKPKALSRFSENQVSMPFFSSFLMSWQSKLGRLSIVVLFSISPGTYVTLGRGSGLSGLY